MIAHWDNPNACVETEELAWAYANTLTNRKDKFTFWLWWFCEWAVLGYDQYQRWDIRVGGECDCSSLIYECLWRAGYLARPTGNLYDHTLYTGTLRNDCVLAGAVVITPDGNPQYGDVLLNDGHHVAGMIWTNRLGQASIDENGRATGGQSGDQTGYETNTKGYYSYPWNCYLRFPDDPPPEPERKTPRPTGDEDGGEAGPVYRLYNPFTGEHLWTQSRNEYDVLGKSGWNQEDVAFKVAATGDRVYRMLNPNATGVGSHHYTKSLNEAQVLWDMGWDFEGIAWRSSGDDPILRCFNPYDGDHFYTASKNEYANLCDKQGWNPEGVAWYAVL